MSSFVVDKLRFSPSIDRRKLTLHLKPLLRDKKIIDIVYQEVTKSGIWRINVDFKEVEDASEFLMKFWGMEYSKKR